MEPNTKTMIDITQPVKGIILGIVVALMPVCFYITSKIFAGVEPQGNYCEIQAVARTSYYIKNRKEYLVESYYSVNNDEYVVYLYIQNKINMGESLLLEYDNDVPQRCKLNSKLYKAQKK